MSAYHLARRQDTLILDLLYPPGGDSRIHHVKIDQESARPSDGIRLHYDFERDGWVVEQPKSHRELAEDKGGAFHIDEPVEWVEVGFFKSWALEQRDEDEKGIA